MYYQVGACSKCGAPIYTPSWWNSVMPPPAIYTCTCTAETRKVSTVTETTTAAGDQSGEQKDSKDGLPCRCLFDRNDQPVRECALHRAWRRTLEWYAEKVEQAAGVGSLMRTGFGTDPGLTAQHQLVVDAGKRAKDALEA